jgi:hypothetical protein
VADPIYYVGLDLGEVSDHSAIAVLERPAFDEAPADPVYALRHLERLPLGTGYPEVVAEVGALMTHLPPRTALIADATGVGRGVIHLLRDADLHPIPVVVHGGQQSTVDDKGYRRIPKREMVTAAQLLLQQGRLKFAAELPLVPVLREELQNFKIKVTEAGNDTYGEWRSGKHDDLVFALALACWYAETIAASNEWIARNPTQPYTRNVGVTPTRGLIGKPTLVKQPDGRYRVERH